MKIKAVSGIMLTLLLIGTLGMVNVASAWSAYPSPNRVYLDPPEKRYYTGWLDGQQKLGENFTISVTVENVSTTGKLAGIEFKVWYNTTLLDYVSSSTPITLSIQLDNSNDTEGKVWLGGVLSPYLSGNITVFDITFNITYVPPYCPTSQPKNRTVSCPLKLNETELVDKDANIYQPGTYSVESGYYEYARQCVVCIPPVRAAFTWLPAVPYEYDDVLLNASTSSDGGAGPLTYQWTITGPATLTGPNDTMHACITTFHCDGAGTVNVTLTVTNWELQSDTVTHEIEQCASRCDAAVIDILPNKYGHEEHDAYPTWTINVNVTALNNGTQPANITVTAYYNESSWQQIGNQTVTNLAPGNSETVTFTWNLSGLTPCTNYTMKANATLTGMADTNPGNNEAYSWVKVRATGDVDGNGKVSVADMVEVDIALGSQPDQPNWNPYADVDGNGSISVADMVQIDIHLGEEC
jgi:hypothetical protein